MAPPCASRKFDCDPLRALDLSALENHSGVQGDDENAIGLLLICRSGFGRGRL
jgi:hypothetical protein